MSQFFLSSRAGYIVLDIKQTFCLVCGLSSQSTAMFMSRRSINLTYFFARQAKTKWLTSTQHAYF